MFINVTIDGIQKESILRRTTKFRYTKEAGRKVTKMKSVYEIQQYLKRFGTIIYMGDRLADLEMMAGELRELFHSQLIEIRDYQTAILILKQEIEYEKEKQQLKQKQWKR